jgi:hypothetical protein
MDSGQQVFRASHSWCDTKGKWNWLIDTGVVTEIVHNGVPLVSWLGLLMPLSDEWRETMVEAQRDVHRNLLNFIERLETQADALVDTMEGRS